MARAVVLEVTLKSGAKIKVKVKSATFRTGSVSWTDFRDGDRQLMKLDYDSIAAVVRVR